MAIDAAVAQASASIENEYQGRAAVLEQELALSRNALKTETARINTLQARNDVLENTLHQLQLDTDANTAELGLYRRIAGSEKPPGSLEVDSVHKTSEQPPQLHVTLIQWRGRDQVAGRMLIRLGFHGPENAATEVGNDRSPSMMALTPMPYQFRFFHKLAIDVTAGLDSDPDFIEIRLEPEGNRQEPLVKRIEWTELSEILD